MIKVAIVLSGCGYLDGSEVYETVLTILELEKCNIKWEGVALNKKQIDVINHFNKSPDNYSLDRNIIEESARITRGNVIDINCANSENYDAIIFPGGYGVAKNIINFAFTNNSSYTIDKLVLEFTKNFYLSKKPAGYICISPLIIPLIYPKGVKATIGIDKNITSILLRMGVNAILLNATSICVDEKFKVISTPGYMCTNNILEVAQGIKKLVKKLISFI